MILSEVQRQARQFADEELFRAVEARQRGLEGRARVCARRAASAVIQAYFAAHNISLPSGSVMDALAVCAVLPDVSPQVRNAAQRLMMRVDEQYQLPTEVDLIAETRLILEELID